MTGLYQKRAVGASLANSRAFRVAAAFGFICSLAGCSISLPMASLVDDTPTGSISAPPAADSAPEKLAAARAQSQVP